MKIILLKDIPNTGRRGDIKEVALGFARNYLFPRGLAQEATAEALRQLEEQKAKAAKEAEKDLAATEKLAAALEGQVIEISAKANDQGGLYGAVSPSKIAAALKEKGFVVGKEAIAAEHIKEVGEHELVVRLPHGLEARITLVINSE